MNSLCLSIAPNLRCQSLSHIQNIILVVPPALEFLFSLTLLFSPAPTRSRVLLVLDGLLFFLLALLDVLAHTLPSISTSITPFRVIDITIASLSNGPLLFYTLFLALLTRSNLVRSFPTRFRRIILITLFSLIPLILVSNGLGSLLGIAHNYVVVPNSNPPRQILGIHWVNATLQHVAMFFSYMGVTLLTLFQATVFTLAFTRCIRAFLDASRAEPQPDGTGGRDEVHMFRGLGWVAAGLKLGAIESVIGFAENEFGVVITRRVIRFFGRGALIIGVIKGMNIVEDFTRLDPELRAQRSSFHSTASGFGLLDRIKNGMNNVNSNAGMAERKPSINRAMIGAPRASTFVHMSPGTTEKFYNAKGGPSQPAVQEQVMPPYEDVHDAPFAAYALQAPAPAFPPPAVPSPAPSAVILATESRAAEPSPMLTEPLKAKTKKSRKGAPTELNLGSDSAFVRFNAILLAHSGALQKEQLEQMFGSNNNMGSSRNRRAGPSQNAGEQDGMAARKERVTVRYDGQTPPVLDIRLSAIDLVPPLPLSKRTSFRDQQGRVNVGDKANGMLSAVTEEREEKEKDWSRWSSRSMDLPIQNPYPQSRPQSQAQPQIQSQSYLSVPASMPRAGTRPGTKPPFPLTPVNNPNLTSQFSDTSTNISTTPSMRSFNQQPDIEIESLPLAQPNPARYEEHGHERARTDSLETVKNIVARFPARLPPRITPGPTGEPVAISRSNSGSISNAENRDSGASFDSDAEWKELARKRSLQRQAGRDVGAGVGEGLMRRGSSVRRKPVPGFALSPRPPAFSRADLVNDVVNAMRGVSMATEGTVASYYGETVNEEESEVESEVEWDGKDVDESELFYRRSQEEREREEDRMTGQDERKGESTPTPGLTYSRSNTLDGYSASSPDTPFQDQGQGRLKLHARRTFQPLPHTPNPEDYEKGKPCPLTLNEKKHGDIDHEKERPCPLMRNAPLDELTGMTPGLQEISESPMSVSSFSITPSPSHSSFNNEGARSKTSSPKTSSPDTSTESAGEGETDRETEQVVNEAYRIAGINRAGSSTPSTARTSSTAGGSSRPGPTRIKSISSVAVHTTPRAEQRRFEVRASLIASPIVEEHPVVESYGQHKRTRSKSTIVSHKRGDSRSKSRSKSVHSTRSFLEDDDPFLEEDLSLLPGMPSSVDDRRAMMNTERILGSDAGAGLVRLDSGVFGREEARMLRRAGVRV